MVQSKGFWGKRQNKFAHSLLKLPLIPQNEMAKTEFYIFQVFFFLKKKGEVRFHIYVSIQILYHDTRTFLTGLFLYIICEMEVCRWLKAYLLQGQPRVCSVSFERGPWWGLFL